MTIRVALRHLTHYRFDRTVAIGPHSLRLRPAVHTRTPIESYTLRIEPEEHFLNWHQDPFGNYVGRAVFPEPARELRFEVEVIARLVIINPFDFFIEEYAEQFPFEYAAELRRDLSPYLEIREKGPLLREWLAGVDRSPRRTVNFLVELNQRLSREISYTVRMEPGVQTCEQTLQKGSGSCRDTGWMLVQVLRHMGMAARFVSGYLVQLAPDIKSIEGPSGPSEDFTDLHAWAEVFLPGAGWVGLDPTSGLMAGEGHIPLACTPDPSSAAPVNGATDICEVEFHHENRVSRIFEDPRTTKPYSEADWAAATRLGDEIERRLQADDVRLTMGGEPTFVGIDDCDAAEWNTRADGRRKRARAEDLLVRMQADFAPGGVVHHGQGKWYPGEPLPRWALACYWRADGEPVWKNPALLAREDQPVAPPVSRSGDFCQQLAEELALPAGCVHPAYEDSIYFSWQEGRLPVDLDIHEADLGKSLERQKLRQLLDEKLLGKPVAHVLPLAWDPQANAFTTSRWQLRREHLYLVPGASPAGFRLPLDTLEDAPGTADLHPQERSLWESRPALAPHPDRPAPGVLADETVRIALCIEVRQEQLRIFLPPFTDLEHYLTVVAAIERTAEALETPVMIEGYEPPSDWRLRKFALTPDPGVLEVNIHPATHWQELVTNTERLYASAREARLTTEKFLLDGRQTGTGGGNHVTIGGPTPADSPILRRPQLLQSLITFWQHHPGLSYVFSGLFIGPTSQAPRVDEARIEQLYELELAFSHLPEDGTVRPWLVDRILRNLLTDLTGNTHRSEFCIDKLYSPDSASGRQGLLEFRAFEMPPHPRMSLVQMLLLRALISIFWRKPYQAPLVRWGSELHDRFLLPHYAWRDLEDVVSFIRSHGLDFRASWLKPFHEFRFPVYGRLQAGDMELELRTAIEPWNVLGEEATAQGTSRFVDSSVERLQVVVRGMTDGRHVITCNGRRLPMRATGENGVYVCGVRFQAWQPPSSLHPTIPSQSPLVFDLFDTWNGRAVAGCTYHVSHPGGRSYETLPVNAWEAEGRRINRFFEQGHTPGVLHAPAPPPSGGSFEAHGSRAPVLTPEDPPEDPEHTCTFDLRRGSLT